MTNTGPSYNTPKEMVKAIRVLFIAMVIGILFFLLMAIFIYEQNGPFMLNAPGDTSRDSWYHRRLSFLVAALPACVCIAIASRLYRKGISSAKNLTGPLTKKLIYYRSFFIRYLALCEVGAIFSIIIFLITGVFWVLLVTAIMILAMIAVAPLPKRLINDLNLDWKEQKELE